MSTGHFIRTRKRRSRVLMVGAASGALAALGTTSTRTTWDALASEHELYAGDPSRGRQELDDLFGRLGADPRGGTCVEIGCGSGRMTVHLAERFDDVLAVDVSAAMVERARSEVAATGRENVRFQLVSGERLDGVPDGVADVLVCYLVLQHLPSPSLVREYLREFGRVLSSDGEAFAQLPVLDDGLVPRAWRALSSLAAPLAERISRDPTRQRAFRGSRVTGSELARALADAGLRVESREDGPASPYRFSRETFLRLSHS